MVSESRLRRSEKYGNILQGSDFTAFGREGRWRTAPKEVVINQETAYNSYFDGRGQIHCAFCWERPSLKMQTVPRTVWVNILRMTHWVGCTGDIENILDNVRVLRDGLQDIFSPFRQQQYRALLHIYARVCVYILLKHKGWNFKRVPLGKLFVKPPKEWSSFYAVSGQEWRAIFWSKAAKHNAV